MTDAERELLIALAHDTERRWQDEQFARMAGFRRPISNWPHKPLLARVLRERDNPPEAR